ncbi:MAG TPA: hypothetical protein VI756_04960 [Blastocatellia bacterium]
MGLLLQSELVPWGQIALFGPTVIILAMLLWFALKAAPIWREFKLKELEVRDREAEVRSEQAKGLTSLGGALVTMSGALEGLTVALNTNAQVVANVAIEQRRATEAVKILQRVNADSTDHLRGTIEDMMRRLDGLEGDAGESE